MEIKIVLYLSFSGYSDHNGISKKKLAQIKGLVECGCSVVNCYYTVNDDNGDRLWMTDNQVLVNLGSGIRAKIRKRIDYKPIIEYIKENRIELVYMRSEHNASPFLIHFVKQLRKMGVKIVMEIPTYPYDQEYPTIRGRFSLYIDKFFRKQLAGKLHAIVTFSNEEEIFGKRTIRISNGIDFSSIPLKQDKHRSGELRLIGVAEIHFWHGFDRIITGLRDYYKSTPVNYEIFFDIVGDFAGTRERNDILPIIADNQLEKYVTLHGSIYGSALDRLFDQADIGIGSLGRHRSGITHIKTLKNREYAARGLPFIYSEIDDDFDKMPYILKLPADESPVVINSIIGFFRKENWIASDIRRSVAHLSWNHQMNKVLKEVTQL